MSNELDVIGPLKERRARGETLCAVEQEMIEHHDKWQRAFDRWVSGDLPPVSVSPGHTTNVWMNACKRK